MSNHPSLGVNISREKASTENHGNLWGNMMQGAMVPKQASKTQHFKTTKFTNLQVTLQQLCLEQFSKETNPKWSKDLAYWPRFG